MWTATCHYCEHAASGDEQNGALEAFGDHFAKEHPLDVPSITWSTDQEAEPLIVPPTPQTVEERLLNALEKLPPDRVVSASELITIIRGS